jgi:hypothetical protein
MRESVARLMPVCAARASSDQPRSARSRASRCAMRRSIAAAGAVATGAATDISVLRQYLYTETPASAATADALERPRSGPRIGRGPGVSYTKVVEPLFALLTVGTLFGAGAWLQARLSKGRTWSPLWLAFSTTSAALLFLVAGSVGFRLDRHTVFLLGSRWSDTVIWWEVGWGAIFAGLAVIFWRLAIRDADRQLNQA